MLGKALRIGLVALSGVYDGIGRIIALHQRKRALHLVAVRFQRMERFGDFRQPQHHIRELLGAVLHILRGELVEGEGAGGNHHGNAIFESRQLAPEAYGIRKDDIGEEGFEFFGDEGVHLDGGFNSLQRHFRSGNAL